MLAEDDSSESSSSVQVVVRVRPFLPDEEGSPSCIDFRTEQQSLRIRGIEGPAFTFDHFFPESTSQKDLYSTCVVPLVTACLSGYNATVLAYGQTGSGKTHTIVGPSIQNEISSQSSDKLSFHTSKGSGMIQRALQDLFHQLSSKKIDFCSNQADIDTHAETQKQQYEYSVRIQFLELYGEEIRDLLSPSSSNCRLTIRDGAPGVEPEVIGASETTVKSPKEAMSCLHRGTLRRVTAATRMNSVSSRSHAIFTVIVEQKTLRKASNIINGGKNDIPSNTDEFTEEEVKKSKFHFVDLAGSERQKRTRAKGRRLKEGIDINKGLLVLGNVISALGDSKKAGRTHVPYRDSKLTRLLKGSLGGNHKTLMIACVSPAITNMEESLNCLRYANRAKNIKNNAVVNLDAGSKMVAELKGKCRDLARELLRVRELCKNDNVDVIRIQLNQDSLFSERLLEDLTFGKDTKSPIDQTKSAAQNSGHEPILNNDGIVLQNSKIASSKKLNNVGYGQNDLRVAKIEAELERTRLSYSQVKEELSILKEQNYTGRAEEVKDRLQLTSGIQYVHEYSLVKNHDSLNELSKFEAKEMNSREFVVDKINLYERELTSLKNKLHEIKSKANLRSDFEPKVDVNDESIQVYNGLKEPSIREKRNNASEQEISTYAQKIIPANDFDSIFMEWSECAMQNEHSHEPLVAIDGTRLHDEDTVEKYLSLLSKHMAKKEEMIKHLNARQEKYEAMRRFFGDKLRNIDIQLIKLEQEKVKLVHYQKIEEINGNITTKSVHQLKIFWVTREIEFLKKEKAEILNFSKLSSRNLSTIERFHCDMSQMIKQKILLQEQLILEEESPVIQCQKGQHEESLEKEEFQLKNEECPPIEKGDALSEVDETVEDEEVIAPEDVCKIFDSLYVVIQKVLSQFEKQIQQIQMSGQQIPEKQLRQLLKAEFERALTAQQDKVFEDNNVDEYSLEKATWEFLSKSDEYPQVKKSVERFQKLYENVSGESVVSKNPGAGKGDEKSSQSEELLTKQKLLEAAQVNFDALTKAMCSVVEGFKEKGSNLYDPSVTQQLQLQFASVANDEGEKALSEMGISQDLFRSSIEKHANDAEVGRFLARLQMKQHQDLMAMGVPAM